MEARDLLVWLLACVLCAAAASEGGKKRAGTPGACDRDAVSAAHGMRIEIRCRVPKADDRRVQVWKYPATMETPEPGPHAHIPAAGGELVFDSHPGLWAGESAPWADGAQPGARPERYSVLGSPPHQKLAIHALSNATQGLYYWTWGNTTHPHQNGTSVLVTMYRPPMLMLDVPPALEGTRHRAVCTARDYYPNRKAEFIWHENGTVVSDAERVKTRVRAGSEGFTATSVLLSAGPASPHAAAKFRCQFVWRRDSVSYTKLAAEAEAASMPRPNISISFDAAVATCTASCVPASVTAAWLLGEDHAAAEAASAAYEVGGCPEHPAFGSARATLPLSEKHAEYTCRLIGYPPGSASARAQRQPRPANRRHHRQSGGDGPQGAGDHGPGVRDFACGGRDRGMSFPHHAPRAAPSYTVNRVGEYKTDSRTVGA
ncbi:envelope glycoprotein C [Leporid alphaherpesvirus 4]|uniref:Envelope glycoprotein C n=1 Tax=Leporid alphaherpesvirus 4 TaxID=481315 RepID=J9R081_9ALPH|nr:envelope glycoprotein C [Leporid alphaherpesvirus 4]AFR32487.1 envelope glycoprotein C [Leporid alphaherpesvirus 4]